MVARIKARQLADATAAKSEARSKAAVRKAATPTSMLNGKVTILPTPAQSIPPSGGRLGLADLKRAALERRARQEAGIPQ
jgi:hypothetical protein